jgi:hypothetical protein
MVFELDPNDLSLILLMQTIYDCNNRKNIGEYGISFLESKPKVALVELICNKSTKMTFNTPEIMPFTCPGYLYLTGGLH